MRIILILVSQIILSGCTSVKVYNQTDMFIDIEARREATWFGCSDTDLKAENSLMTFYLLADDVTHEFMFRKVMSVERCLNLEKEYQLLTEGAPKVRVVGLHPLDGNGKLITARVPQKFNDSNVKKTWTFIRFSTVKGCESYFEGGCQPKNYWGGVLPPKKSNLVPSP